MKAFFPTGALPATAVRPAPVYLADLTARNLALLLVAPPAHLSADCWGLAATYPRGVCHFVSQLLVLRSRGTGIRLCQVHPVLQRCLHGLALGAVFDLNG
ncbi:hypothetical protein [Hymenobacter psychrophilus]|uniref:Uncharacterized protein n=1 Tax=Hymenobacter psychrophilus TaxID=651662 RepID=A0A1H3MXP2_9BACT|nr:hypothetical protein [Hymenobacter psychrophilus]SDY81240.1 hypothetical protein SAMN04488069_11446 [Hymenobacter psychrophilus]